jgi:hypothetical protein
VAAIILIRLARLSVLAICNLGGEGSRSYHKIKSLLFALGSIALPNRLDGDQHLAAGQKSSPRPRARRTPPAATRSVARLASMDVPRGLRRASAMPWSPDETLDQGATANLQTFTGRRARPRGAR